MSNFTVALESYQYNNDTKITVPQKDTSAPYELTVTKSFCKLNFSYAQEDGVLLKYYQFSLYNNSGALLGTSQKIYGIPNSGIMYAIENYNNLQHYILKLYCVTQDNEDSTTTVNIYTNYDQDSIYANISFAVDKENATNNIMFNITQLNGTGENYWFDGYALSRNDYVVISENGGYVNFTDTHQIISKNFLCRMWCLKLTYDTPILTIKSTNGDGYIEVIFTGQNFIAYKHSCGIVTTYISNTLSEEPEYEQKIYFALGYYDGRIEMYTTLI